MNKVLSFDDWDKRVTNIIHRREELLETQKEALLKFRNDLMSENDCKAIVSATNDELKDLEKEYHSLNFD